MRILLARAAFVAAGILFLCALAIVPACFCFGMAWGLGHPNWYRR